MQATALKAENLSCRRGDRLLFGSLDITLDRGDALHVIGPNGVGKTSLLRMLCGLLAAADGQSRIAWQGRVGLIDQRPALDEYVALERALRFWRTIDDAGSGDDGHAGAVDLSRLGLDHLADVPVRYLSTGQRKRAAFARLIGQNADHWLLDEPLNGLDLAGIDLVAELVAERRARGGAVIVASHQPIALADARVIDLRDYPA